MVNPQEGQRPSSLRLSPTRSESNGSSTRKSGSSPSPTSSQPRRDSELKMGAAGKRKSMTPPSSEPKPFVRRCACLRHKDAAIAAGLIEDDNPKKPPASKKKVKRPSSVPPKRSQPIAESISQPIAEPVSQPNAEPVSHSITEPEISPVCTPTVSTQPNSLDFDATDCPSTNGFDDASARKLVIPLRYSTTICLKISSTRRRFTDSVDFEVIDLSYDDIDGGFHEPILGSDGWFISEHCVWH